MILCLGLIFAFSLMLVTTASPAVASRIGLEEFYFIKKHIASLCIAAIAIFALSCISHQNIKRIAIIGYFISLALIMLTYFYGQEIKGAKRWINVLWMSIQPSEFIKPCFAVVVGWLLSMKKDVTFPSMTIVLILYALIAIALMMQPDFGMLITISAVLCVQVFVAGIPLIWIVFVLVSGITGIFIAYATFPHIAQRIKGFLDPAESENYQVSKSISAFEHGGLYGCGPGEGTVKQHIPDSHADFIFAVAGEEFGIITCMIIAGIFTFIVVRGIIHLTDEENKFICLSSLGLLTQFGLQAVINMGVAVNLLPTKGMTLPFISYGGSSTLAIAIGIGMLLSLTRKHINVVSYKLRIIQ